MSVSIIERLQTDHRRMQALLAIIERQCEAIAACDRPDYTLMYQVLHYLTYYPDRYHHVLEDLLFERLQGRTDSQHAAVKKLARQHVDIAKQGSRLRMATDAVLNDLPQPRVELVRMGRDYVAAYREHLEVEDSQIFPALTQYLQPIDWMTVLTRFEWQTDPLFAGQVSREYHAIVKSLLAMGVNINALPAEGAHKCPACSELSF